MAGPPAGAPTVDRPAHRVALLRGRIAEHDWQALLQVIHGAVVVHRGRAAQAARRCESSEAAAAASENHSALRRSGAV